MNNAVEYVRHDPYVSDDGIHVPSQYYVEKGFDPKYKLLMSKDVFIDAYNRWIKGADSYA